MNENIGNYFECIKTVNFMFFMDPSFPVYLFVFDKPSKTSSIRLSRRYHLKNNLKPICLEEYQTIGIESEQLKII